MPTFSKPFPDADDVQRFKEHVEGRFQQAAFLTASAARLVGHRPDLASDQRLRSWIEQEVQASSSWRQACQRVYAALRFLKFCGNPDLHELLAPVRSPRALIRALTLAGLTWDQAVQATRKPRFESELAPWFEAFLKHRAGRQMQMHDWAAQLRRLDRLALESGARTPEQITPAILQRFLTENRPSPRTRNARLSRLRGLQRFLEPRGAELHLPAGLAVPEPDFRPHIFTLSEIGRVLGAMRHLGQQARHFRWLGIETIVFLLYACGMRLREPLGLRVCDVDLDQATLFLHCTKFYKQRWVPLGAGATRRLQAYREARQALFPDRNAPQDPFFLSPHGRGVGKMVLQREFGRVVAQLHIASRGTARRPRLHDLRHTLAVHRMYQWYSEGADVQNKLPLLSAYLGHDRLHHTEAYLHLTDDLIRQAGRSFQRSFEQIVGPWSSCD